MKTYRMIATCDVTSSKDISVEALEKFFQTFLEHPGVIHTSDGAKIEVQVLEFQLAEPVN